MSERKDPVVWGLGASSAAERKRALMVGEGRSTCAAEEGGGAGAIRELLLWNALNGRKQPIRPAMWRGKVPFQ
jgi:hypothetical protein